MSRQQFKTKVEAGERGRVFITIPFVPSARWGKKARHFVKGTLNGTPFSGSLGSRGGVTFFPINKELQAKAALGPGDPVSVVLEPDDPGVSRTASRDDVPEDVARALTQDSNAREFFHGLSAFYRTAYLKWITEAKKAETRATRIAHTVKLLGQGKKQR